MEILTSQELSEQIEQLAELRRSMAAYLAATTKNVERAEEWLEENRAAIILSYAQLDRALTGRDDKKAATLLAEMGEVAGVVLGFHDFVARAKSNGCSRFLDKAEKTSRGLPDFVSEKLPAVPEVEQDILTRIENITAPETEEKASKLSVSTWFNRKEKRAEQAEKDSLQKLYDLKRDILSMQDEQHYYLDGVMESLAAELAGENDSSSLMQQYQRPDYILSMMRVDQKQRIKSALEETQGMAEQYTLLAQAIDRQDIPAIVEAIKPLYPAEPTAESMALQQVLAEDYQVTTLGVLFSTRIHGRDRQALLSRELHQKVPGALPPLKKKTLFQKVASRIVEELLGPPLPRPRW